MVKFYQTEKKLTLKEINDVEKKLNFTFPEEYKQHLLKYNGGRCEPNAFDFIENKKKLVLLYTGSPQSMKVVAMIFFINFNG